MKKVFSVLTVLLLCCGWCMAQPDPPPPPGGGGNPGVPISGIELLLTLGGLFGASRFLGKGKSKKN